MKFGDRIKAERKKNKISAQQLSELCGISRSYITLIENNMRMPSKVLIPKLAVSLNISVTTIINWYLEGIRENFDITDTKTS